MLTAIHILGAPIAGQTWLGFATTTDALAAVVNGRMSGPACVRTTVRTAALVT